MNSTIYEFNFSTPVGELSATYDHEWLISLRWGRAIHGTYIDYTKYRYSDYADKVFGPSLAILVNWLNNYFNRIQYTAHNEVHNTLKINATDFYKRIWQLTTEVSVGHTMTYGELASLSGHSRAARAVGTALRLNPIVLIIPCHRIIPSSNGIGQYAGGNDRKKWLLEHEQKAISLIY